MTRVAAVHLFLALVWGQLVLGLAPVWRDGTYYSYGWLATGACVFFYLSRRRDLPQPRPFPSRPVAAAAAMIALLVTLVLAIAALRLMQGANPFWRLILWLQALLTLLLTAVLLAFTEGGRATRHYLPALLLVLIAVPLPSVLEASLVQNLTRSVILFSSDLARSVGIPLEVADTAFIIRGQALDVNDQCSGIRSFQSSVAVALIVGELLRLHLPARLLLLLLGAIASFTGNALRVMALVQAFFDGGSEGMEARHDTAGMVSLTLTYGFILAAGFLLDRWFPTPTRSERLTARSKSPLHPESCT